MLEDMFIVWDALFADSKSLDLTDYICVAMLLYLRNFREYGETVLHANHCAHSIDT